MHTFIYVRICMLVHGKHVFLTLLMLVAVIMKFIRLPILLKFFVLVNGFLTSADYDGRVVLFTFFFF